MNKEQKIQIVSSLTSCLTESKNIYFTEVSGLDAEQTSKLRRMCFDKNVSLSVVKNTLLKKAMDACDKDFSSLDEVLKGNTTLMISDISNAPAKVIKNFCDKENIEKTNKKVTLKGGHIEESIYVGHEQLELLISLKSKEELIGDVITLLQSPVKNLLSSLDSAKQNISGLLTSLEKNPKVDSKEESQEKVEKDSVEETPTITDNKENIEKNDTDETSSVE